MIKAHYYTEPFSYLRTLLKREQICLEEMVRKATWGGEATTQGLFKQQAVVTEPLFIK